MLTTISFVMPAIYDSLKKDQGLTSHVAWRVSFIVPFILINAIALGLVLTTDDTPTGKWADRAAGIQAGSTNHQSVVSTTGDLDEKPALAGSISSNDDKKQQVAPNADIESATGEVQVIDGYQHEVVVKPSFKVAMQVVFSLQTAELCAGYFNSFGAELAVNSALGSYYLKNFPSLGQTQSGRWAAMFGLLNIVTRPLGGFIGDLIYRKTGGNLWAKKSWIHVVGVIAGTMLIIIGQLDPHDQNTMIGLIALFAIFLEAGNGANFAMVPHIHPHANGKICSVLLDMTMANNSKVFSLVPSALWVTSEVSFTQSSSGTTRRIMRRRSGLLAL
jgi:NNP family nitrate/nitrite transporter-like MFS transporter